MDLKLKTVFVLLIPFIFGCDSTNPKSPEQTQNSLEGTWKLMSGTLIEDGDTTVTDYTGNLSMIKIINATHFSFLSHDTGKDSTSVFAAGGGVYTLDGDQYMEYLEYCSDREWEGNTFQFTVTVKGDTLTQQGEEKIENLDVKRLNIEKYARVKDQ